MSADDPAGLGNVVVNLIEASRMTLHDAAGEQVTRIESADAIILLKDRFAVGAYSDVFRATWTKGNIQEQVVVKQLRFNGINMLTTATNSIGVELNRVDKRLGREMRLWRRLSDACLPPRVSYVTPLLGYVESTNLALGGDSPCLISLYRQNGNLLTFLAARKEVDRINLLVEAAEALEFMHTFEPPTAHLDISPRNILINDDDRPEFCDFGLAKALEDVRTGFTTSSKSQGTIGYGAPELLLPPEPEAGAPPAGPSLKPDIYSFGGVILFTMSGHHPWYTARTFAESVINITGDKALKREHYPIPGSPELQSAIWVLVDQCRKLKPEDRPTASEILKELRAMQSLPV